MGSSVTGGTFAVPIFTQFMAKALEGKPPTPFNVPPGMSTAWINPNSGVQAFDGEASIEEAFKPGTGPNLMTSVIGVDVNAVDAVQRQQMMQQQYDSGFVTQSEPPPSNQPVYDPRTGEWVDASQGRGGLF